MIYCICFCVWLLKKLEAQEPFIAHLITVRKKVNKNDRIQINACVDSVVGNTSECCCEHLVGRRISLKEKSFLYLFCPAMDLPLWISGRNHYKNGSILSKAFCLWHSLWILLALPWIHPLIKSLNTCAGNENFISTKCHKHPSSGSVVKADYFCSHIYTCISASPLPSPK